MFSFGSPETKLAMQRSHKAVCKLPQLSSGHLGALGHIRGVEGKQIISCDEGLVERGQQVRIWFLVKVRQHLQQIRHGPSNCSICAALRMDRHGFTGLEPNVTANTVGG